MPTSRRARRLTSAACLPSPTTAACASMLCTEDQGYSPPAGPRMRTATATGCARWKRSGARWGRPTPTDLPQAGGEDLALYVHWPFCVSKCPYCDFNSHVRASIDQDAWRHALLADIAHEAHLLPGRKLTSIFFGGGTPSLMDPATVEAVIASATQFWAPTDAIEITVEANPNSVEAARF